MKRGKKYCLKYSLKNTLNTFLKFQIYLGHITGTNVNKQYISSSKDVLTVFLYDIYSVVVIQLLLSLLPLSIITVLN